MKPWISLIRHCIKLIDPWQNENLNNGETFRHNVDVNTS